MKEFLYDDAVLDLLRSFLMNPPQRIITDGFHHEVLFDCGDHHYSVLPEDYAAASRNSYDEAITVKFRRIDGPYTLRERDRVEFDNPTITRLWVLRTFLHFTPEVRYRSRGQAVAAMTEEERADPMLSKLLADATGHHEERYCRPDSEEAAGVDPQFANLVDAGVMLEVDGKYLGCFSNGNSYAAGGHIFSLGEIAEDVAPYYEFIEVKGTKTPSH
jgi:hypothetical protein